MKKRDYYAKDYFENGIDLYVNKHHKSPRYGCPPHHHDFAELAYTYSGRARHIVDGVEYPVERGTLIFINYNSGHAIEIDEKVVQIDILLSPAFISKELAGTDNFLDILALSQFSELREFTGASIPCTKLSGSEMIFAESILDRIASEFKEKKLGWQSAIRGLLSMIFTLMIRSLTNGSEPERRIPREILEYIDKHYSERLTGSKLAEMCFYNPTHFARIFRESLGVTVKDYIRSKRIDEAERLMRTTELPIDEVIGMVGYTNRTNFYRAFEERVGCTPAEARQKSI